MRKFMWKGMGMKFGKRIDYGLFFKLENAGDPRGRISIYISLSIIQLYLHFIY